MPDLVQTPTSVVAGSGATTTTGTLGETVDAGMPVYLKAADSKYYKAIATSPDVAAAIGLALNGGGAGQPVKIQTGGNINPGAVLTVGETYYVSNTAGKLMPSGDLSVGEYVTRLGMATTASNLLMDLDASGVVHG
jgi:hypothetical protein